MAIDSAVSKLLRADAYKAKDPLHALSVLDIALPQSQRLAAEAKDVLALASAAVSGHMRFVRKLSKDRTSIETSTPCEPLLSMAAMSCLRQGFTDTVNTLNTHLLRGGKVDRGLGGEFLRSAASHRRPRQCCTASGGRYEGRASHGCLFP